jgi:hypothetical protein
MLQDLGFFCREFRKRPALALTAIISLALGIGLSARYSALIPPFPGPQGFIYPFVGRIAEVAVYNTFLDEGRICSHIMNAFNTD